tara:strand:+ start:1408 stop:1869 length:462 start_codon:yes stop_codon:yes gene_type:complete
MCEHQDSIIFDTNASDPIDSSLGQIETSLSNVLIDEGRFIDPARTAAFLLKSRAVRLEHLRESKPEIDDISWHILLDLMVSKNVEKPVSSHDLAITHNVAMSTMTRYVEYLSGIGLIDKNIDAEGGVRLELTASGDSLTSDALRKIGHELENF